jgi:hypothetical protein
MGHADYPGIYHMVGIAPEDWHLLPDIPEGQDAANLDAEAEAALERAGYIIGRLQRVIFYEPGVKETNWSATRAVMGVDGVERRWVYLHYFKSGQPSINWLDPSFAGMRLVIGDALHALADLGSGALRLDANGFLGVEKSAEDLLAWSEGHPLSEAANQLIASMIRKMGGFSFQELNLTMDDIKAMSEDGADLSYDFVTRPAHPERPYNRTFTTNSIACTTASVITATLGIRDLAEIGPAETAQVTKIHLLLAMFNALQPGVFALSGSDLTGILTLDTAPVSDLIADGDTRWINRGAHDLIGAGSDATRSEGGMPAGRALYGPLPAQLEDPSSFASRLSRVIAVPRRHGIATRRALRADSAPAPRGSRACGGPGPNRRRSRRPVTGPTVAAACGRERLGPGAAAGPEEPGGV